jgi:hypothetical protein
MHLPMVSESAGRAEAVRGKCRPLGADQGAEASGIELRKALHALEARGESWRIDSRQL